MADDRLLVRRGNEPWSAPEVGVYRNEEHLQKLLAADPQRVPGIGPGAEAVCELSTAAGPADVCIVGARGDLTVVECKLASNPERRRMVIGQVLDYAAAIWTAGFDEFSSAWRARNGKEFSEFLDVDAIARLRVTVADGRIHLCLAVDVIDAELRRLIEFLNRVTRTDVMVTALQLGYAKHGDIEILIPTTYGAELATAKNRAQAAGERWSRERFLEAINADSDRAQVAELFERLDQHLERRGNADTLWYGAYPGGSIFFYPYGLQYPPFYIWINSHGRPLIYGAWRQFQATTAHPGFEPLAQLLGQDFREGPHGVPVDNVNVDVFWQAALAAAAAINEPTQ
jgi:hypothetical protein